MNSIPISRKQRERLPLRVAFLFANRHRLERRAVAKQTPMMEMTRRYGHALYSISAYSNSESGCTYEEKWLQLIHHEMVKLPAGTQYNEQMNDCAAPLSASC